MRILICSSAPPLPPMDGFRLLLDHLVRGLRASHEVRVVAQTLVEEQPRTTVDPGLRLVRSSRRGRLHTVVSAPLPMLRSRPLSDDRRIAELWPTVKQELAAFSPDIVHVTSGRLAGIAPRLSGWTSVLGAVDARHLNVTARAEAASGVTRLALHEQARRIRRLIATEYQRFGRVTVVTAQDREALLTIDPRLHIAVIPNGVDTTLFRPDPTTGRRAGRVTFTGTMNYAPNVTAAESLATEVLPRLQQQHRDVSVVIAGREPTSRVRDLAGLAGVTVTGEVPDIRPWLASSHVFAAPMSSGTGIKNKLLEAMACGLPCVASPLALQGIQVEHGRHVLVAEGPDATAEAISRVLNDTVLAADLGREARRYVEHRHSWSRVVADHVELYENLLSESAHRSLPGHRQAARSAETS